ncbi:MAG TPA: DUF998 domain-containing protein [Acidimicrobiales bacterium]|nr:DUF998 domain-containing protein [Acidimicrobiales bacterium]
MVTPPRRAGRAPAPLAAVIAGLAGSALALALAPAAMPASYSWTAHTTSESAAQGVAGAWVARLGFVLLGVAVVGLAALRPPRWPPLARGLHAGFGVLIVAAAVFSSRSWEAAAPYDRTEDVLHSLAASTMGIAFAGGVVAVGLALRPRRVEPLAAVAVVASIGLPLAMVAWDDVSGLLQRAMFAVAYAWYGTEAVLARHA